MKIEIEELVLFHIQIILELMADTDVSQLRDDQIEFFSSTSKNIIRYLKSKGYWIARANEGNLK